MDQRRVEQAKQAQLPVIYGDASQEVVLEAAHVAHARLVLVTTPAIETTHAIVTQVNRLHPGVHIVARAEGVEAMQALQEQGVYEVVQSEFEASLEITRQALLHFDISPTEIQKFTDTIRQKLYALFTRAMESTRWLLNFKTRLASWRLVGCHCQQAVHSLDRPSKQLKYVP